MRVHHSSLSEKYLGKSVKTSVVGQTTLWPLQSRDASDVLLTDYFENGGKTTQICPENPVEKCEHLNECRLTNIYLSNKTPDWL
uniref:Uncharacterized protein n=1 Tax=Glossina palpalis gambiensis TaxID=67801 RepID=A0A1B0AU22_9MUSC